MLSAIMYGSAALALGVFLGTKLERFRQSEAAAVRRPQGGSMVAAATTSSHYLYRVSILDNAEQLQANCDFAYLPGVPDVQQALQVLYTGGEQLESLSKAIAATGVPELLHNRGKAPLPGIGWLEVSRARCFSSRKDLAAECGKSGLAG